MGPRESENLKLKLRLLVGYTIAIWSHLWVTAFLRAKGCSSMTMFLTIPFISIFMGKVGQLWTGQHVLRLLLVQLVE